MMEITLDEKSVKVAEELLGKSRDQVNRASYAAINRTLPKVRKLLVSETDAHYVAKKGAVRASLRIIRAGSGDPTGMVKSSGSPLPLKIFQTRFPKTRMASARVLRTHGLRPVKGLFRQNGRIFQRRQPARYPLAVPMGPSAPQMVGRDESVQKIIPEISAYLNQRFTHEIAFRFKGLGG